MAHSVDFAAAEVRLDARLELCKEIAKKLDTFAAEALREDLRDESRAAVSYVRASNFVRSLHDDDAPSHRSHVEATQFQNENARLESLILGLRGDLEKMRVLVPQPPTYRDQVARLRDLALTDDEFLTLFQRLDFSPETPLSRKDLLSIVRTILAGLDALSDLLLA